MAGNACEGSRQAELDLSKTTGGRLPSTFVVAVAPTSTRVTEAEPMESIAKVRIRQLQTD